MEMGARSWRCVSSVRSVASTRATLRTGKLTDDEWPRLTEAIERCAHLACTSTRRAGSDLSELRANARRLARQCGQLGLIVVDYLQLMSGSTAPTEKPGHRTGRDLARPQDAGQGTQVPGDRLVAAQPQRRNSARTSGR
jgi:replicative DNA helicase